MKKYYTPARAIHWQASLAVTMLFILLICIGSFFAVGKINSMEEEKSFDRLYEEARGLAQEIESSAKSDREQLALIAAVIAGFDDLTDPVLWSILDSYETVGMLSRLDLLLPDDTLITQNRQTYDVSGVLSFQEEAALGAHISNRETDIINPDQYILRHCVPVVRDGDTIALLYGIADLSTLPEKLFTAAYNGSAALYIIDGNTGDFLVDTWHNEPGGNIWALGERQMAPGYDHEQLKQGLIDGQTGYVVFISKTIGRHLYFCYEPIAINEWRIALSVPEEIVFSGATQIHNVLNVFLVFETICFVLYFLWMICYVRRETNISQRQVDTIRYIYNIEKLLFNAHEQQENISQALKEIADITGGQAAVLWLPEQPGGDLAFTWTENTGHQPQHLTFQGNDVFRWLLHYFQAGHRQFTASVPDELNIMENVKKPEHLRSLSAVPVEDVRGNICGILAAVNIPDGKHDNPALLESAGYSFSMFCRNMQTYNTIKAQGERDTLSGLYNRNRYEMDLSSYTEQYRTSLACVYIDANGLHELNNQKGHAAGDRMLQEIARQLRDKFGDKHSYRIGGDEFLAFAIDTDEDTVLRLSHEIEEVLEEQHFHISIGIQWETSVTDMESLVKEAELKMYTAKQAYYQDSAHDRRART